MSDEAKAKKQQLMEMARNGEPRPLSKAVFNSQGYDPEFDAEIRKMRPDWFKKTN